MLKQQKNSTEELPLKLMFAYASAAEFAFSVYLFEWRRYKREKINSLS